MDEQDPRATYDEGASANERKSAREEAPVWSMLGVFAILGALATMLVAFTPGERGGLFFGLLTLVGLIAAGAVLFYHRRHRRHRLK